MLNTRMQQYEIRALACLFDMPRNFLILKLHQSWRDTVWYQIFQRRLQEQWHTSSKFQTCSQEGKEILALNFVIAMKVRKLWILRRSQQPKKFLVVQLFRKQQRFPAVWPLFYQFFGQRFYVKNERWRCLW